MKPYLDEMLRLTAEIAEELLVVKDTDNDISIALSNKISRLADIAAENAIDPDLPYYQNYNPTEESYPPATVTCSEAIQITDCEKTDYTNETNEAKSDSDKSVISTPTAENETIEKNDATTIDAETSTIDIVDENIYNETTAENSAEIIVETADRIETPPMNIVPENDNTSSDTENADVNDTAEITEDEQEQIIINEEIFVEEMIAEPEEEPAVNETAPLQESQNQTRQMTASLEQMRSAFSLNDLFLFRRIICGGSTHLFNKALCDISSMNSVDEITAYLAENFNVNPRNPDVREFIAIVSQFISY